MIDLLKQFEDASREFAKLRGLLAQALKLELEPGMRQYLESLSGAMEQSVIDVREAVPRAVAKLDEEIKGVQSSVAQTETELAQVSKKIAELEAAPLPVVPPPPAPPPLDPRRGRLLGDELLGRFAKPAATADPRSPGEVVEMTSGDFRDAPQPTPSPLPPATPKETPRKAESKKAPKDVWDLSSGTWRKEE